VLLVRLFRRINCPGQATRITQHESRNTNQPFGIVIFTEQPYVSIIFSNRKGKADVAIVYQAVQHNDPPRFLSAAVNLAAVALVQQRADRAARAASAGGAPRRRSAAGLSHPMGFAGGEQWAV
jgi:hypothetical protein